MTPLKKANYYREGAKDAKKSQVKLGVLGGFAVQIRVFQWSHLMSGQSPKSIDTQRRTARGFNV
jgi:hypothetical protein